MPTAPAPTQPTFSPATTGPEFFTWRERALELLSQPHFSLQDVADTLHLPLSSIVKFVLSQDGLEAMADIQAASIIHARTAAVATLPRCVKVLKMNLDRCVRDEEDAANHANEHAANPPDIRETRRDRARRSAYLLLRLANFTPKPFATLLASSSPQGGGAAAAAAEGAPTSISPSSPHPRTTPAPANTAAAHPVPMHPVPTHPVPPTNGFAVAHASTSASASMSPSSTPSLSSPVPSTPHAEGAEVKSRETAGGGRSSTPRQPTHNEPQRAAMQRNTPRRPRDVLATAGAPP